MRLQNQKPNGYTLIELLAVMVVLIVVGAVVGQILFSVLRGTNKANTLSDVNQNGNYAISQISKMIRSAQFFDGVTILVGNPAVPTLETNCTTSITNASSVEITSFDGGTTTFSCPPSPTPTPPYVPTISSSSALLTNASSLLDTSSVEIDTSSPNACYFTCSQDSFSGSTRIGIHFALKQFSNAGVIPAEEKTASVIFQTSVVLRNPPR